MDRTSEGRADDAPEVGPNLAECELGHTRSFNVTKLDPRLPANVVQLTDF